jgi:hypothetical protein
MKPNELTGPALNWAVARALGKRPSLFIFEQTGKLATEHNYSTDWAQGGPIIEREAIDLSLVTDGNWRARHRFDLSQPTHIQHGPTPLIAAMRVFVESKLGDEVELPENVK